VKSALLFIVALLLIFAGSFLGRSIVASKNAIDRGCNFIGRGCNFIDTAAAFLHRWIATSKISPGGQRVITVMATNGYEQYANSVLPPNERDSVVSLACKIVEDIPNDNKQEMVLRLFGYVTRNIHYRSDVNPGSGRGENVKTPMQTERDRAGDCEDSSILLASLLESVGFQTYLAFTPERSFMPAHVFVLVKVEKENRADKLGAPFSLIAGDPLFALESTHSHPLPGPPHPWGDPDKIRSVKIIKSCTGESLPWGE
jgi:hypothetical protein